MKLKTKNWRPKTILTLALMLAMATVAFADWTLPVSINSGTAKTNLTIGVSSGATNGYDQGLDSPTPFEGESLNAYFPHPDWGVVVAGTPANKFHRDIRGGIPQDFYFEILSTVTPVTIKWDTVGMPEKTTFMLYDHTTGIWIDMRENVTYTFNPSVNPNGFTLRVAWGDLTPPLSPTGIGVEEKVSSLFITWSQNTEGDLAGYKIHFGKKNGTYERTVDIKNVNNYSLLNLSPDSVYYIALTAYDEAGNESPYSMEVSGKPAKPIVTLSVSKSGTGSGTVTGSGISCGTDCSETYSEGTSVTLTPTASAGSTFAGWSGCNSISGNLCTVTMNTNRTVTATFNLTTAPPDLRVSSLTAPTTGGAGTTISVTETTRNNGRGSAGASTTRFYLSKNRTLDAGDALLGSRAIPALAGGASSTGTTSVTIPSGTSTGRYYIIAKADGHNAITETNENNNTRYRTIRISP